MNFDRLDTEGHPGNHVSTDATAALVGRAAVEAMSNSPLMASVRELASLREVYVRLVKGVESPLRQSALRTVQSVGRGLVSLNVGPTRSELDRYIDSLLRPYVFIEKRAQQGILQMTSGFTHQLASLGKRLAELGPPTTEMVLAAYDASKALAEGDAEPMDRFLTDHLKLPATPDNRKLLRNIIDSSLARDIRQVRDQWLVLGPKEAQALVRQVNRGLRLYSEHKDALLAYGTFSDPKQRKGEELPAAVYYAWSDIQLPGNSSTLVDAAGNYLKVPLAGEKNAVQFEDMARLDQAVARQSEIQEFELREAGRLDAADLQWLVEARLDEPGEVRTCLDAWADKAGLSGREAQIYELDMRTYFNTVAAAQAMGVPENKARDYRSRYSAKLRRAAGR